MMSITRKHGKSLARRLGVVVLGVLLSSPVAAFDPSLPDAAGATFDGREDLGSVSVPMAAFGEDGAIKVVEGAVRRRAWLIPSPTLPTLRIAQDLRDEVLAAGYDVVLDCLGSDCGGFDFRFSLPVLPAPQMNVDLFDFRVLTATKASGGQVEYLYFLISRGRSNRYLQMFEVVTTSGGARPIEPASVASEGPVAQPAALPAVGGDFVGQLTSRGHVVLADLEFATGADALSDRDYASLASIAAYLKANPAARIVLVGHTDSVGSLDGNTALSKRRAQSVRQRLLGDYNIPEAQVTAEGAGYLSPIQSNLSPEGREANRRVEAVLLAAE